MPACHEIYTLLALICPALKDQNDFAILAQRAGQKKRPGKEGPGKLKSGYFGSNKTFDISGLNSIKRRLTSYYYINHGLNDTIRKRFELLMLFIDLKWALMVILLYKILYLVAVRNIFGPRGRAKWFKICDFLAEGPGKKGRAIKRPGK